MFLDHDTVEPLLLLLQNNPSSPYSFSPTQTPSTYRRRVRHHLHRQIESLLSDILFYLFLFYQTICFDLPPVNPRLFDDQLAIASFGTSSPLFLMLRCFSVLDLLAWESISHLIVKFMPESLFFFVM